jgi:hypothetical protein
MQRGREGKAKVEEVKGRREERERREERRGIES